MLSLRLLVVSLSAITLNLIARDEAAVQSVADGKQSEARAEWWGFDEANATKALQAAIHSKAKRVIIGNTGKPWIVEPIQLRSDLELVFEKGVEIVALRGGFQRANDSLFGIRNGRNITLTGAGATLRMWKSDYQKAPYSKSEWRHALSFHGCENIVVNGLTVKDSGGDGIYLGTGKDGPCKHVTIRDAQFLSHHRQGISVINVDDLLIEHCAFSDTAGTAPMAGIDFEPNSSTEHLKNCVLRDCSFERNASAGVLFALGKLDASSDPISVVFENCVMRGNQTAMHLAMKNPAGARGAVDFNGCTFADSPQRGVILGAKTLPGARVTFNKCTFTNLATAVPKEAPIVLTSRGEEGDPLGGVTFNDCVVEDALDRHPVFYDDVGGLRVKEITGTIKLKHGAFSTNLVLTQKLIDEWFPWSADLRNYGRIELKPAELAPAFPRARRPLPPLEAGLRGDASFGLPSDGKETLRFTLSTKVIGKNTKNQPLSVKVTAPSGKTTLLADARVGGETNYSVATTEVGVHRILCAAGQHAVSIASPNVPANAMSLSGAFHFIGVTGKMYFLVPAGVKEFAVRVAGDGGLEQVRAIVANAKGEVVANEDRIARSKQLVLQRASADAAEVWSLQLARPAEAVIEDVHVMFDGVPSLLAASPESLIVPKGTLPPVFTSLPTIVCIGDSTVSEYLSPPKDKPTLTGWGQVLNQYLKPGVKVRDEAVSGTSTKSFLMHGFWQKVVEGPCDYLFIQFGHNDQKDAEDRHTGAGGTYDEMLRGYVHMARGLGIKPVLVTSVARMVFDEQGKINSGLADYVAAMKHVAETDHVPLIDLHGKSVAMLEKMGPKEAAALQACETDRTHFSRQGGLAMARLVAEGIKEAVPELAPFVVLPTPSK